MAIVNTGAYETKITIANFILHQNEICLLHSACNKDLTVV
jgi:hypothetical protein